MNRFIVVIPNSTVEHAIALKARFHMNRVAWWHWSNDVWLLSFPDTENPTTLQLQKEIQLACPDANLLVFRFPDGTEWSGWGPEATWG
jgi:hypothetical protein